jgi:hypothetical protein
MTRPYKKLLERHYLQSAACVLQCDWRALDDREIPDFIVEEGSARFGIEITEIFAGSEHADGAILRKQESIRQKRIRDLQRAYEAEESIPLIVQLVGYLSDRNIGQILPGIRSLDLAQRPVTYQTNFKIEIGDDPSLSVYVTKSLRPNWFYVDDRVGAVRDNARSCITGAIERKSNRLEVYKREAGTDDIRLLVVANRIQNSGKLILGDVSPMDLKGFRTVYFFSYPESVSIIEEA